LKKLCLNLAKQVVVDGEGAKKFLTINVINAKSLGSAKNIAFSIANTPLVKTARQLVLTWGLHCVVVEEVGRFKEAVAAATKIAKDDEFGAGGEQIIVTAGIPFNVPGSTNILRVAAVD
ncbi:MAG: bifunctional ornithine acetyltransferase/N-acetylglutamate synthase, partial [Paracoccaceae bacterium]